MRLATFNVLHGRSPADGRVDLDRFADAVATLDADVLALQEVDRGQPRSAGADLTAVAARAGSYADSRFVPALTGLPGTWRPAADADDRTTPGTGGGDSEGPVGGTSGDGDGDGDEPAYGVALLSRVPVLSWRTIHLPALRGPVPVWFTGRRRPQLVDDEPRVAAVARLDAPGGPVTVVSTHLSFLVGWNLLQLRRLVRGLTGETRLVVAGDLNMPPHRARRVSGLRSLAAGMTFPAEGPVRQLDHLLGHGVAPTSDGTVWELPLSDHRALSVEVDL